MSGSRDEVQFDELQNLHEVRDGLLIERKLPSYSEFAEFLEQNFADQPPVDYGAGPTTWAQDSVDHRAEVYDFGSRPGENLPKLGYDYSDTNDALLKQRLNLGGMRLAQQLDQIFAPKSDDKKSPGCFYSRGFSLVYRVRLRCNAISTPTARRENYQSSRWMIRVLIGSFIAARRRASRATASVTPSSSNMTRPGLTRAAQ